MRNKSGRRRNRRDEARPEPSRGKAPTRKREKGTDSGSSREAAPEVATLAWRDLVFEAPVPMLVHADDGEVLAVNPAWTHLSGYDREDVPTLTAWLAKTDPDANRDGAGAGNRAVAVEPLPLQDERRIVTANGEHRTWALFASTVGRLDDGRSARLVIGFDVSERRRTEGENALLATFLRHAQDAIEVTNTDLVIEYVNPAHERITGYRAEEALGRTPAEINRPEDHDPAFYADIVDTLERGRVWRGILRSRRKDGSIWHAEATISPVADENGRVSHYIAVKRDITDRMRAEEDLRQSETRLRAIVDNADAPIVLKDTGGRYILVNRMFAVRRGRPVEEIEGRTARDIYPADVARWIEDHDRVVLRSGRTSHQEVSMTGPDGVRRSYLVARFPVADAEGRPIAVGAVATEVTALKEVQRALTREKIRAEQASKAKSEFLAAMSHELRTPLNAIIGFSEIISQELMGAAGNPRYREYAEDIRKSGLHLQSLIDDILDLSKIEAGRTELSDDMIDLAELVAYSVELVRPQADLSHLRVIRDLPDDLPRLRADRRATMQILLNLLSNAVKFSRPGDTVIVRGRVNGAGELTLAVEDTGIGIDEKDIPHVVERFVQIRHGAALQPQGTGLGLAVVKSLAELHGGRFTIDSRPGIGTVATVAMPPERVVSRSSPGPTGTETEKHKA